MKILITNKQENTKGSVLKITPASFIESMSEIDHSDVVSVLIDRSIDEANANTVLEELLKRVRTKKLVLNSSFRLVVDSESKHLGKLKDKANSINSDIWKKPKEEVNLSSLDVTVTNTCLSIYRKIRSKEFSPLTLKGSSYLTTDRLNRHIPILVRHGMLETVAVSGPEYNSTEPIRFKLTQRGLEQSILLLGTVGIVPEFDKVKKPQPVDKYKLATKKNPVRSRFIAPVKFIDSVFGL